MNAIAEITVPAPAAPRERMRWTPAEDGALRSYWEQSGSLIWAAHKLQRTLPSTRTHASRLGITLVVSGGARGWSDAEDARLARAVDDCTLADGRLELLHVAALAGRSPDATLTRMLDAWGRSRELLDRLSFSPTGEMLAERTKLAERPKASGRKLRKCLGWCGRHFESEGAHERVCKACKRSPVWD